MWFLPTRRAHLIERFFSVAPPTEPGILIVDKQDVSKYQGKRSPWPVHVVKDCHNFCEKVNKAFADFPNEPYYGVVSDDTIPETPGWDVELAQVAGKTGIAVASQVHIKDRPGCGALGGDLVRALGWLCCPAVKHFYSDDVNELIGAEFGCFVWRKDIRIAHHHFSVGLAPYDASYKTRGSSAEDKIAFENWKATEWPVLRERLAPIYAISGRAA